MPQFNTMNVILRPKERAIQIRCIFKHRIFESSWRH